MANKKGPPVDSIHHQDKRVNIPTEELRDFVGEEERTPKTILYPRDPSLDPQLVWKGKDEQDQKDLAVPVVPIYVQEKIQPQAIINALPRMKQPEDDQPDLFADFDGGPAEFDQKVDFYHHDQNWSNRMILGDSLLVMTSLAEKEGLKGKVQTAYIDPPYGIKFDSNWQVSTRKRDVKDGKAEDATRQPEQIRAFRDTWKLGIHSYLAYLRDRLVVARELLTETGSVFVQIGDENVHLVRSLMDEVFGAENFFSLVTFRTTAPLGASGLPTVCNYLIWYAKNKEVIKYRQLYEQKDLGEGTNFVWIEDEQGSRRLMTEAERRRPQGIGDNLRPFYPNVLLSSGYTPTCTYDFQFGGRVFAAQKKSWRTTYDGMQQLIAARRLMVWGDRPCFVQYHGDFPFQPLQNLWTTTRSAMRKIYVVETDSKVVERCVQMTSDPGDLVLDPTCGGGTSAYVAEKLGRRWITCDTSRVALALARTRLMAARYPYYLLADSVAGIAEEAEITGKREPVHKTDGDVRKGFVYKRVPHVTLKSIANNPDIHEGMTRKEIDVTIAQSAESELIYDQPYEDNKRVRVSGPFTVESLSPHRVLSTADDNQDGTVTQQEAQKQQDFAGMILDNLRKAGVQNTRKNERIKFERLDSYPGSWIQAAGEYTDAAGKSRRVAVSIGPEHGTVGPQQVKEAAKEAVQGVGFDMLIVCGFAFDPHVSEETKRYGKLTVLAAKMNPDLAMGDELLKKTGAGNLFMVFGEPDVDIKKQKDGNIVVEIKGVDVYDPTTGQVRNSSTDDIACWFIDTDYNGESFFVRHAYFTGAEEPYENLKRALRADIDESAWSALYSTISRPFPKPQSGKFAVKVINHYGDEVLKVFSV
jgi:adenine-specific DNA-methyltransferase